MEDFLPFELYGIEQDTSEYFKGKRQTEIEKIKSSATLYIGNLSFYTLETRIYLFFSQVGTVKKVIMGLNKNTKNPCGFCFVEYYTREEALKAVNLLNNRKLDGRVIRVDWDIGFEEGRQYGRGYAGGQKRDEFISNYDPDRPNFKFTGKKQHFASSYNSKNDFDNKQNYSDRRNYDKFKSNKYSNEGKENCEGKTFDKNKYETSNKYERKNFDYTENQERKEKQNVLELDWN